MPNKKKNGIVKENNNVEIMDVKEKEDFSNLRPKHPSNRCPGGLRTFTLCRRRDESGISGTGVVLEGVIFATGQCVLHWLTPIPKGSVALFENLEDFVKIHIKPHPQNDTIIVFDNNEILEFNHE